VANAAISKLNARIEGLQNERDALSREIGLLRAKRISPESEERALGTKERSTLLKLLVGMAITCYKYDPRSPRSSAHNAIADELSQVGITITNDTVRKWLKAGVELVPQSAFDNNPD
jgi:hypothetical protein